MTSTLPLTPFKGWDAAFAYDDIGNRTSARFGGSGVNSDPVGSETIGYTTNALNQYEEVANPRVAYVLGTASYSASNPALHTEVTINSQVASRMTRFFASRLEPTGTGPKWEPIHVELTRDTATRTFQQHLYVPPVQEVMTYDEDGNLTLDGRWTYAWDGENRLVGMVTATAAEAAGVPGKRLTFAYDGLSRRVQKKVETRTTSSDPWVLQSDTRFVYDGWNMVGEAEYLATAADAPPTFGAGTAGPYWRWTYVWGEDVSGTLQGAGGVGGLLLVQRHERGSKPLRTSWAACDLNGNVIGLVESNLQAVYDYDPFGKPLRVSEPEEDLNPFQFSTKYTDAETGLCYYGFRYYNPETGRWLGRDPAEEGGGLNLYGFIGNNGVNGVDFLGLWKPTGNNQYEAEAGDTLRSLAQQVSQSEDDWSCLWPVSSGSGRGRSGMKDRHPNVCPGDVYDASNLATPCSNAKSLSLILERDFASMDRRIFPGAQVINGNRVAQRIRSVSGEGKTPINNLVITGHCGAGSNSISGTTSEFIFFSRHGSFNLQDLLALDKPPTFDRAKAKKGPLRCWFARETAARFVACSSETFAQNFASRVLRRGSTATGTNQTIGVYITGGQPVMLWDHSVDQQGNDRWGSRGDFWNAPVWRTYNGGL